MNSKSHINYCSKAFRSSFTPPSRSPV